MGKVPAGLFLGLLVAAGGCAGPVDGEAPGDVVESRSALAIATAGESATAVSADVAAELSAAPSILEPVLNLAGIAATSHTSGVIDRTNPFFLSLGANGRTCETCHDSRSAWTTSPIVMSLQFEFSAGTHPLFASLHDSGSRLDAPVGTLSEKRAAFKPMLQFGVHRFTRTNHVGLDYAVTNVDDPWGGSTLAAFASFRRAGTNMGFTNRIASSNTTGVPNPTVRAQLEGAMNGGTLFHAQGTVPLTTEQRVAGADFMLGLSFAQIYDFLAGRLDQGGARGGPVNLAAEPYPVAGRFDLYDAWLDACGNGPGVNVGCSLRNRKREQIARGQELFNTMPIQVSGVAGLNDEIGVPVLTTTCSGCHRAKNVGSSTSVRFMDIGVAAESNRPPFLPLITIQKDTGEIRKTTDLGRAASTRLWADVGKVRVLGLRGLASRAPYFHAGQAKNIGQVLNFYATRFNISFTAANRADLEAFLLAL
jgi:cytochrome c peroxidase